MFISRYKLRRRVYTPALTGSESSLFVILQSIVLLVISGLFIAAFLLHARGNKLWKPVSALFVLSVLPFLLGGILPYGIQVTQSEVVVNDPIYVEIIVRNPFPLPVWYPGADWIMLDAVPTGAPEGSESGVAVEAAGQTMGRTIVMPWGSSVVHSRRFLRNETGGIDIRLKLKEGTRTESKTIEVMDDPVVFDEIILNRNVNQLPFFGFLLENRDTRAITAINVELDGQTLPWNFGVDRLNPVESGEGVGSNVFIAWYDPQLRDKTGSYPIAERTYELKFHIRYEDGYTRTRTKECTAVNYGTISTISIFDHVNFFDESLFSVNDGGVLSLSLRNNWQTDESQSIQHIEIYLNGTQLASVDEYLPLGTYWSFSSSVPFELDTEKMYRVSVRARSRNELTWSDKLIPCEAFIADITS